MASTASIRSQQRFTQSRPCPVCGGYEQASRGQGRRCWGFLSDDGEWCHCTRSEHAGGLPMNEPSETYPHRLSGVCRCGSQHGPGSPPTANGYQPEAGPAIIYVYRAEDGTPLYEVCRFQPKRFIQRRPNPRGGYIPGLGDVKPVLYRLPELLGTDPSCQVFITEGEKDCDNLAGLGLVATCNPMGAGKWHVVKDLEPLRGCQVVILPDNDDPGRRHAQQVARSLQDIASSVKVVELLGLPDKGDVSDWLDQNHTREELLALVESAPEWELKPEPIEDWPPLGALPQQPSPPSLPPELLPDPLRDWIVDIAERASIPPEYVACPALVGISAVVGRGVGIQPGQFDDWLVVPNLWGGIVGRPGVMKSYAVNEALRPLDQLAAIARDRYQADEELMSAHRDRLEAQIAGAKAEMVKAAKRRAEVGMEELETELADLKRKLREARAVERRYMTQDATVEKLGELLKENPRGLLVSRDELAGWLRTMDRPGREGDREFYLESWNGSGGYTFDRIGRGTVHIPAVCLSIVGGIQPGKLNAYIAEATSEGGGADGLLQRLQMLVWPDGVGPWKRANRWPDKGARERAFEVFKNLDSLTLDGWEDGITALRFAPDAQELFDAWREELENRLRSDETAATPAFESHLSKYRSLMPSLALLFHLIDVVDPSGTCGTSALGDSEANLAPQVPPVSLQAARLAAAWCDFLEDHARKMFASELNPGMEAAHKLAERIASGEITNGMGVRAVYRHHWEGLGQPSRVVAGLEALAGVGWIRFDQRPTNGRPEDVIHVHPELRSKDE